MDLVGLRVVFRDRREGIQPDMKVNFGEANPLVPQFFEQLGGEVQPGGWCRGRTHNFIKNSLIAFGIALVGADIRRQGHMPRAVESTFNRLREPHKPPGLAKVLSHLCCRTSGNLNLPPRFQPAAPHQALPAELINLF